MGTNRAYGDSITYGVGATTTANSYIGRVSSALGQSISNNAVNATLALDALLTMMNQNCTDGDRAFLLAGYNDMRHYGASGVGLATFESAQRAMCVWNAVPHALKVFARNSRWVYTGAWSNVDPYGQYVQGKYSSTDGDKASIRVFGSAIYIGYVVFPAAAAKATVKIDGVVVGSIDARVGQTSVLAPNFWPGCARFGGLGHKGHDVEIIVDKSDGGSQVFLDYVATNEQAARKTRPTVFAGNTLRMNPTGYALGVPAWSQGSDDVVAQYNAIHSAVVDALALDGLDVRSVNAALNYNPEYAGEVSSDNQHPTDLGHQRIADAFISKI